MDGRKIFSAVIEPQPISSLGIKEHFSQNNLRVGF